MRRKKIISGSASPSRTVSEFVTGATGSTSKVSENINKYDLPTPWGGVVKDTLKVADPVGLAKKLRDELVLSRDELNSYTALMEAINNASKNYDDAMLLYRISRVEDVQYSLKIKERVEILRTAALRELMEEYKQKLRKSPTVEEVDERMVSNWPDEYVSMRRKESELHGASKSLEALARAWFSRAQDLRIMAELFLKCKKGQVV